MNKVIKLFLLLALAVSIQRAFADEVLSANEQSDYELVYLDKATCRSIVELKRQVYAYDWSETFKNLCLDIQEGGNVAPHEHVEYVVSEGLAVIDRQPDNQFKFIQTQLEQYKTLLDAGQASIQLLGDNEPGQIHTRGKSKSYCKLCVRCLSVKGTLIVNGVNYSSVNSIAAAIGAAGLAGPAGATGATGAAGGGVLAFGMFYGLTSGTGRVPFPRLGPAVGGIASIDGSSFTLPAIGTYEVTFRVHTTEPGQLELELNGAELPQTVAVNMDPTAGGHPIIGNAIITTSTINSVLAVINPPGNSTALTITPANGAETHANAQSITIIRLA